jgi:hypothetical protein
MGEQAPTGAARLRLFGDEHLASHRDVQYFTIGAIVNLYFTLSWGK